MSHRRRIAAAATSAATPLSGTSTSLQGRGELNVGAAIASAPQSSTLFGGLLGMAAGVMNTGLLPATGLGSLEGSRGSYHIAIDGVTLAGEQDIMGATWSNSLLALATRSLRMWSADGTFNHTLWIGGSFATDTTSVAGKSWGGRTWAGRTWSGRTWSGRTWSGRTWSSATWTGSAWSSSGWVANTDANSFAASSWSSASWK
jgi:serine protease AprX